MEISPFKTLVETKLLFTKNNDSYIYAKLLEKPCVFLREKIVIFKIKTKCSKKNIPTCVKQII
jgi:hypothetical protein